MNFDKKSFLGKLNSDIDERLFSAGNFRGDYSDAYNVLVLSAIDSGIGLVKGFKGTTEVPITYDYSSTSRKIIGRHADIQTRKIYFFIAHSTLPSSNDGIYELDVFSKTVTKVIKGSFLKLNNTMRITGIDVVDGKYLLYTDGVNTPRNIDIVRAKAGELTTEMQISALKRPPINPPKNLILSTDLSYLDNNIRGNYFQFKYRYIYEDNTKSTFSPISKISKIGSLFMPEVEQDADWNEYNQIEFTYEVDNSDVRAVEIAVRSGNTGDFGLIDTVTNFTLGENSYIFKNNNILLPISVRESNLMYDRIPLKALAQKVVNGSNVVYGGVTEGRDVSGVNISADYLFEGIVTNDLTSAVDWSGYASFGSVGSITVPAEGITITFNDGSGVYTSTIPSGTYTQAQVADYFFADITATYPNAKTYKLSNVFYFLSRGSNVVTATSSNPLITASVSGGNNIGVEVSYNGLYYSDTLPASTFIPVYITKSSIPNLFYYENPSAMTLQVFLQNLCDVINVNVITVIAFPSLTDPSKIKIYSIPTEPISVVSRAILTTDPLLPNVRFVYQNGLKTGDSYTYGIAYADEEMRVTEIISNENCKIDIPFNGDALSLPKAKITVSSRPPVWAKKWFLYRTKRRRYGYFLQFGISTIGLNGDIVELNFNNSISNMPFYNDSQGTKLSYSFAEGDRLKFVKYKNGNLFPTNEDLPILGVREDGALKIPKPKNITLDFNQLAGCIVEVYRPNTYEVVPLEAQLFYEIGLSGTIENFGQSNRYHSGYVEDINSKEVIPQSSDLSSPLIITPSDGDVWYKTSRLVNFTVNPSGVPVGWTNGGVTSLCSDYQSDRYPLISTNIGRANAYNKNAKQVFRKATMYFSESYFVDSSENNINRIYADSFKDYDQTYGAIKLLYLDGFSLYNFQENKVGVIPVLRQMVFNQDGSSNLILSSQLLNDCRYFDYVGGINNNPESFCFNQFNKYFVDIENNAVCKIGGNGIIRISDIGMVSHFTEVFTKYKKTNPALASGQTPRFYGAWDEDNKLVIFAPETIIENPEDPILTAADTIAYSETQNGWSTKIDFKPSAIIGAFGELFSWSPNTGKLWTHNTNNVRNLFYGVQTTRSIEVPSCLDPNASQSFLSLIQEPAMLPNDRFDSVEPGSAADPSIWNVPVITTALGQESNLLAEDFEKKEGLYFAGFYRDTTTPVTNPLLEGDALKGVWIKLKLTNSSPKDIGLNSILIGCVLSKRTGA